jgi:hypothetical protein
MAGRKSDRADGKPIGSGTSKPRRNIPHPAHESARRKRGSAADRANPPANRADRKGFAVQPVPSRQEIYQIRAPTGKAKIAADQKKVPNSLSLRNGQAREIFFSLRFNDQGMAGHFGWQGQSE